MGRIYAGILGPLALVTCVVRGAMHGGSVNSVLLSAWCGLVAFAAIGYALGRIAEWVVGESVHATISAELTAEKPSTPPGPEPDASAA